jgi:type 1 fimbria pilin
MKLRNRRAVGADGRALGSKVLVVAVALAMLVTIILSPSVTLANGGDIRFTGTVTDAGLRPGYGWWNVTVEKVIGGPQPCRDVIMVYYMSFIPVGYIDHNITIGDTVDVYGSYNSTDCSVSLNGNVSYHITKIPVQAPTLAPLGIAALVGLLTVVATSTMVVRRKQR